MVVERIKKHFDFIEMQHVSSKAFAHTLILQVRQNDKNITRIGYTVTKRIDKRAVVRNRLRRQMREIVRLSPELQTLFPSHDLILIARKEALEKTYTQLTEDFSYLLTQVKENSSLGKQLKSDEDHS